MSDDKKPRVDITNRPSGANRHTSRQWAEHIEVRETRETRQDIRNARAGLGKLTTRFVIEAMCAGENDEKDLIARMLSLVDGDQLIEDLEVDLKHLRNLADDVGGERTERVIQNSVLKEIQPNSKSKTDVSDQQVELLRALLKTMDPEVVKKALTGG